MAVSKRTRFEVLRRDSHACRYCGASAPEVKLTVDHVMPKSLGGSDGPDNLVAACRDCNAGKSSTSPDEGTVAEVAEDAVRWAKARALAVEQHRQDRAVISQAQGRVYELWSSWDKGLVYIGDGWESTIERWLSEGLSIDEIEDCYYIASGSRVGIYKTWRYMCGVARNRIADIDSRMDLGGDRQ